ncbi:MAG: ATP-dependent DNA ligase [Candidatus Nanoarchaeia archaeon]
MKFSSLVDVYDALSQTNSRLEKTAILATFLQKIPLDHVDECILLLQGMVYPEWEAKTLGLAAKLVLKALAQSTGHSESEVLALFKQKGDLGEVAQALHSTKKQQTLFSTSLTVQSVFSSLRHLASQEGIGSQDQKLAELSGLLTSATSLEAKFLVRIVLEDLRVGVAQGTIRDALAYAYFTQDFSYIKEEHIINYTIKYPYATIGEAKEALREALDLTVDVAQVVKHVKQGKPLSAIRLKIGTPCRCMLARKEKTFEAAFARTGLPVRLEYKYDGFRMQIHKKDSRIWLFTRRLEDVTAQFPDVVAVVKERLQGDCIVDAEIVGYDPKTSKYQPFQHISKRIKRKYDIGVLAKELPVEILVFDILLIDSKVVFDKSLSQRLDLLRSIVVQKPLQLILAKGDQISTESEARAFYQKSLAAGNEGIMIKNLNAPYQPGGRVSAWIKMKPTMQELDLVIVGAQWGNGKRSKWLTSFTLACRTDSGDFVEVGKVGTGMKEKSDDPDMVTFAQLTSLLEPLIVDKISKEVVVKPEVVVEIAYEEIQKSPTYGSGYALRFPRVIRLRPDRALDDIAYVEDIEELYYAQ